MIFYKFPSTPHIAALDCVRDDKVFTPSERDSFLSHYLIVEEKVDGANLGISFDDLGQIRLQNRGNILSEPYTGQWKKISDWLEPKINGLFDVLNDNYVLFGEWCYARHTVCYSYLPDWFVGFDVLDIRNRKFLSTDRRDKMLQQVELSAVHRICEGYFTFKDLEKLLGTSYYGNVEAEGLYLRYEIDGWLESRAKLVRPKFVQQGEIHWEKKQLKLNKVENRFNIWQS